MTTIQAYGTLTQSLGVIDWDTDEFVLMLFTSSYTPDINTDQYVDDLSGELSASGYTSGGETIANTGATYSDGVLTVDGEDVEWNPITATGIRYGVIADVTPATAEEQPLVALIDFEENVSTGTGGTFKVSWHEDGIVTIEANPEGE